MDTLTTGTLLREVARLHVQLQREDINRCNSTSSTQCMIITELGRSGQITLAELGRRLGLDKGWVSRTVESLAEEGLVHKVAGEMDRRLVLVSLSPDGEARYQALNRTLNAQAERVINRIPDEDHACLYRALHLLQGALQGEKQAILGNVTGRRCGMMGLTFRSAVDADWSAIAWLLSDLHLPLDGAEMHLNSFMLAYDDQNLVGCAALERYGEAALLRSVAVSKQHQRKGLGQDLVRRMMDIASAEGIQTVVLLTTTADQFFPRFGFGTVSRNDVPKAVKVSAEFQGACPDTATVMLLRLDNSLNNK